MPEGGLNPCSRVNELHNCWDQASEGKENAYRQLYPQFAGLRENGWFLMACGEHLSPFEPVTSEKRKYFSSNEIC